jgi:hypothetical protein
MVRFPWVPSFSADFIGPEAQIGSVFSDADPIVRYDVQDEVDAEYYPDGIYWRFENPNTAGKRIVIFGHKVTSITDVFEQNGQFFWATRK